MPALFMPAGYPVMAGEDQGKQLRRQQFFNYHRQFLIGGSNNIPHAGIAAVNNLCNLPCEKGRMTSTGFILLNN